MNSLENKNVYDNLQVIRETFTEQDKIAEAKIIDTAIYEIERLLTYINTKNRVLYVVKISGETNWRETHNDTVSGYYLTLFDAIKETKKILKTAYEDTAIGDIDIIDVETSEKLKTVRIYSVSDMN